MSASQQPHSGDPFNTLPPELRLELLVNLHSRTDVVNAARASPALYRQSKHPPSAAAIRRAQIMRVFPEDEDLQNALYFIRVETDGTREVIDDFSKRGDCRCPDPFAQNPQDLLTIDRLYSLSVVLESWVEHYVRRAATVDFSGGRSQGSLRWMRQGLPQFSTFTAPPELWERMPHVPGVWPDNLTWKERQILFHAFLSFELFHMSHIRKRGWGGPPKPTERFLLRKYDFKRPPTEWIVDQTFYFFNVMWRDYCWGQRKFQK